MPVGPTVSFELFPPRGNEEIIWGRMMRMAEAHPDYFTVTYGASGASREGSDKLIRRLLDETSIPVVAHVICVGISRKGVRDRIAGLFDAGVTDFLALRGDPPADARLERVTDEIPTSVDLVRMIREMQAERGIKEATVAVAAYPSGRHHGPGEFEALLAKEAAGADRAITQVFYDAEEYASFVSGARAHGITIPIVPGILPLTDRARLKRLYDLSGVAVPATLDALLSTDDDTVRLRRGVDATLALLDRVLAVNAPGIHLYTFNRDHPAIDVLAHMRERGLENPAYLAVRHAAVSE
ncbi:MAG TPA: methylenetetrahydrofolate reductase [Actinomycetaceae bacterium]|nr:methylenetetrahydrofolate reductase [Actinomycetaceae bacterium]